MPPANSVILSKVEALEDRFCKTEENQFKINELVAAQGAYQESLFKQLERVEVSVSEQITYAFNGVGSKIDLLVNTVGGVIEEQKKTAGVVGEHHTRLVVVEESKKNSEKWRAVGRGLLATVIGAALIAFGSQVLHYFQHLG